MNSGVCRPEIRIVLASLKGRLAVVVVDRMATGATKAAATHRDEPERVSLMDFDEIMEQGGLDHFPPAAISDQNVLIR